MKTDTIFEHIPLVSVAMTTYNGEKYLKEQIDSILNQSYKNIELVICDDCSKDGTWRILQEYATMDNRIKIVQNSSNLGFIRNFEQAISLCTGDFIALSDQDDIWEPWKLEESLQAIESYDLVCTNSLLVDENNNSLEYTLKDTLECYSISENQDLLFKHLCFHNFAQGSTMLARAQFLKSIKIPVETTYRIFHDHWYALNATVLGNGLMYIDKPSIRYRQHQAQVTVKKEKKEFLRLLTTVHSKSQNDDLIKNCNASIDLCKNILKLPLIENKRKFVLEVKKYFECMKNKNWYTFCFFVKYHDAIYLDNHAFRKTLRIAKRFLGLLIHKIEG